MPKAVTALSAKQHKQIKKLYDKHTPLRVIHRTTGIARTTLQRYFKQQGWETDKRATRREQKQASIRQSEAIKSVSQPKQHTPQLIVLQDELSAKNRELTQLRRTTAYDEMLLEAIRGTAPAFPVPPIIKLPKPDRDKTDTLLVAVWSDHHVGRVVKPHNIEGFNEYNIDIFANRIYSIVRGIISVARAQYTYSNNIVGLAINLLGDIANDDHRDENKLTNQFSNNISALIAAHIISQAIDLLRRAKTIDDKHYLFPTIEVRGVVGNEGRFDKKLNFSEMHRHWDWIIYQFISCCLANDPRVKVTIPYSPHLLVSDLGWKFLLSHGFSIKGTWGIPYYGVWRDNSRQQALRRESGGFDYRLLGHFHADTKLPDASSETYINGALTGSDGYAHNALSTGGKRPTQLLLAVTEKRGVIASYSIHGEDNIHSPFVYDEFGAKQGALQAMELWKRKRVDV